MTVSEVVPLSGPYSGNDVLDEFDYTFFITDETELVVTLSDTDGVETVQTLTTDYTVTRDSETGKGIFTMGTPPATGEKVSATLDMPADQTTNLRNKGPFFAETHETFFDKSIRIAQQLKEELTRCLKVGPTSGLSGDDVVLSGYATIELLNTRAPILLDEATAAADATLEVTTTAAADYDLVELELLNIRPASDDVGLWLRGSIDGGSSWLSLNNHRWKNVRGDGATADFPQYVEVDASDDRIYLIADSTSAVGNVALESVCGRIKVHNHQGVSASQLMIFDGELVYRDPDSILMRSQVIADDVSTYRNYNGYQIAFSAGNITSGTLRLWGMPKGS